MTKFNPLKPVPCVYWKHGAYWYVKRGKWEQIGKTLEQALAAYAEREQSNKLGKLPAMIDAALLEHFRVRKPPLAESTKEQYRIAAKILKRKFARFDSPDQIQGKHVAKVVADGYETPNMTNRVITVLRVLFKVWLRHQLCSSNPCFGVERYEEAGRERLITMPEWWAIYDQAGPRLRVIMKVAFLTGQRIGDVLTIHRTQLGQDGIEFRQQKTSAKLVVNWSPDLRAAVDEALAIHGNIPQLWLFASRPRRRKGELISGNHANYGSVLRQWHVARKAAGVEDALPNDQRAQSLTNAEEQGFNPTALAGHVSEAMTRRYLRGRKPKKVAGPALKSSNS